MFEQKKNVANLSVLAQLDQPFLQAEAGSVVDGAELENGDHL